MQDVSNPTTRVIDVVNFLAANPTEAFTLTEIAGHVGLSNGSAHRLLTTLANAKFLTRNDKHRTYTLGVAMVAIGQAAVERHRGVEVARREIARLAVELNVQCSANAVVDGEILVLVKEGSPQTQLGLTRVGERRPLLPPLGMCHVAWGSEATVRGYIEQAGHSLDPAVRDHLLAALPIIRKRGYSLAAYGRLADDVRQAMVQPAVDKRDAEYWQWLRQMIADLTPPEVQVLDIGELDAARSSYISAPVFAPDGTVGLQLVLSGIAGGTPGREVERYAERLCATAAIITSEIHGRRPAN